MAVYRLAGEDCFLHLPVHGGVRLRATDSRLKQLSDHWSDPLMVVERDLAFTLVTFAEDGRLSFAEDACTLTSSQISQHAPADTLDAALAPYLQTREKHLKYRAQFKRAITLDMWLSDERIAHDYHDVTRLIAELDHAGLADGTLLYLPGWHAPYDKGYPAYAPADALGGEAAFSRMFAQAQDVGLTIMLHLNFWGYDATLNLLPDYESFQVRDASGELMGWPGVTRTGSTHPLAYMQVQDERWQALYMRYLEPLLYEYPVRALFLDQMGTYHGIDPQFDAALPQMLQAIRRLVPDIVLGGETPQRGLLGDVGLFQAWGQPWCGLSLDLTDAVSPIVGRLYAGQTQLMAHLGLPSFVPCRYVWTNFPFIVEHGVKRAAEIAQQHGHAIDVLPHVRLNYRDAGLDPLSLGVLQSAC